MSKDGICCKNFFFFFPLRSPIHHPFVTETLSLLLKFILFPTADVGSSLLGRDQDPEATICRPHRQVRFVLHIVHRNTAYYSTFALNPRCSKWLIKLYRRTYFFSEIYLSFLFVCFYFTEQNIIILVCVSFASILNFVLLFRDDEEPETEHFLSVSGFVKAVFRLVSKQLCVDQFKASTSNPWAF